MTGIQKFLSRIGRAVFIFLFSCSLSFSTFAEDGVPSVPKGLLELEGLGNPVYLYVPDQYTIDRALPLIISLPKASEDLADHAKEWRGVATRRSLMVMVPYARPRDGDAPYRLDEWLIKVKKAIEKRYHVAPDRIYLIGNDEVSSQYAAYLGTKYGEEFSGVGLVDGAWNGALQTLVDVPDRPVKQVPFFLSFSQEKKGDLEAVKEAATEYVEKGYILHVEVIDDSETHTDGSFRRRMLDWLEEKNEKMIALVAASHKNWKEQFRNWVERNIKVK